MGEPAAFNRLKQFTRASIFEKTSPEFMESLRSESDRGLVILATTLIEDTLSEILHAKISENAGEAQAKRVLSSHGLAGNFAAQIQLALAMGLIDKDRKQCLDAARHARNACAHSRAEISFDTAELRSVLCIMFRWEQEQTFMSLTRAQVRAAFIMHCGLAAYFTKNRVWDDEATGPEVGMMMQALDEMTSVFPHLYKKA